MKNRHEIRGEITAIFLKRRNGQVLETLISTDMLEKANSFEGTWCALYSPHGNCYYARGRFVMKDGSLKWTLMHRFLMDASPDKEIDHINSNTLDNTDTNLREIYHSQNMQNKHRPHKNNKSGILGVCWHKRVKKWYAQIRINNKKIYLGIFDDIKEAENAVIKARKELMPYSQEAMKNQRKRMIKR